MFAKTDVGRKMVDERLKKIGVEPLQWFQFTSDVNMTIEDQKLEVDVDGLMKHYCETDVEMAEALQWVDKFWELHRLCYRLSERKYDIKIEFDRKLLLLQHHGGNSQSGVWTEEEREKIKETLKFFGIDVNVEEFELKVIFSLDEAKNYLLTMSSFVGEKRIPYLEKVNSGIWETINEILTDKETE